MFDERNNEQTNAEAISDRMHQLAHKPDGKIVDLVYTEEIHQEMVRRARMRDIRDIDAACVKGISTEMCQLARDIYGDKLDKMYLYDVNPGGKEDADLSYLVVLKVAHDEICEESRKLQNNREDLGLKYDVLFYTNITSSEFFDKHKNSSIDYIIPVKDGLLLYG